MRTKENARPTVGAVEQAQAGNVLADSYSRDYCTSNPVSCKLKISDFLGTGRQNAVDACLLPVSHYRCSSRGTVLLIEFQRDYIQQQDVISI